MMVSRGMFPEDEVPARSASVCEVHWGHRTGDAAVPEGTSEPEGEGGDGGLAQDGRGADLG